MRNIIIASGEKREVSDLVELLPQLVAVFVTAGVDIKNLPQTRGFIDTVEEELSFASYF